MKRIILFIFINLVLFSLTAFAAKETKPMQEKKPIQDTKPVDEKKIDPKTLESFSTKNPFVSLLPEKPTEEEKKEIQINSTITSPNNINVKLTPTPPQPPPKLIISGIVWHTHKPQAIINGKVVNQGDTIEGAKVLLIKKTGIDMIFNDINFTIKP